MIKNLTNTIRCRLICYKDNKGEPMKPLKLILILAIFILTLTSPGQARTGGQSGGGGHSGSHSSGHSSGSHSSSWSHSGHYYGGHYYGRGYYGWGGRFWGPGPYYWYGGWPYYYPPAYYYSPPPVYDYSTPPPYLPPAYSNPSPGEVTPAPSQGGQVFIYPRQGQGQEKQAKDWNECQAWATQQTGVDLTKPPPTGMSETQLVPKSEGYYRALDACMDGRGYTIR
jgi:hypothetical protein